MFEPTQAPRPGWTALSGADAPVNSAIAQAVAQLDYTRRSPFSVGGPGRHKEWLHFVVFAPEVELLVNFSLCDDTRETAAPGAELPRLVLLVRDREWDGDVDSFTMDEVHVRGGRIDLAFAHNRLHFDGSHFEISARLAERPVSLELRLTPVTMPACVPSLSMLDGPPLRWVVVPRLEVSGVVRVGERQYNLDRAPAYHDHNWGHFLWGHDISWEWGFVLPPKPSTAWCATFVRLTNQARSLALAQTMLLWRGDRLAGMFREEEMEVHLDPTPLAAHKVFKAPRVMALVVPGLPTDVPSSISFHAERGRDWVDCVCTAEDVAQVLIPAETRLGATVFNEVLATTTLRGRIDGETVQLTGRSILEFIREY